MEAINNHTDFPVLSPGMTEPSQGPELVLVSAQLVSEGEGLMAPKGCPLLDP